MKFRFYLNTLLAVVLIALMLFVAASTVSAMSQTKVFNAGGGGHAYAETWEEWQVGNYYRTRSYLGDTYYQVQAYAKGWDFNVGSGDWYLVGQDNKVSYWSTQTTAFISEWDGGESNAYHYAQRYSGVSGGYAYTSEKNGWDSYTCWIDPNDC